MTTTPSTVSFEALAVLAQHRYLTREQLRRLVIPDSENRRAMDVILEGLATQGLADGKRPERRGVKIWFATDKGRALLRRSDQRAYTPSVAKAGSQNFRHTWAVNEVGTLFAECARERGDDFGPYGWENEILLRDAPVQRSLVIADALLHYTTVTPDSATFTTALLELDRGSYAHSVLMGRLRSFAEVRADRKSWEAKFPEGWPRLLVVVAAPKVTAPDEPKPHGEASWIGDLNASRARIRRMMAYCREFMGVEMPVLFATLPDLRDRGPFADIWASPYQPETLNWLGGVASAAGVL